MVVYIGTGETLFKATKKKPEYKEYHAALHAYTYDPEVEGKKQLKKNVAATMGYWTGSQTTSGTAVNQDYIVSGYSSNDSSEGSSLIYLLKELKKYIESDKKDIVKLPKGVTEEQDVEWVRVLFIPDSPVFYQLMAKNVRLLESLPNDVGLLVDEVVDFFKPLLPKSDNVDLKVSLVKGGLGAKRLYEELGLAGIMTQWGTVKENYVTAVPLKTYENPECDIPKIISANRWYFRTGKDKEFWDEFEGHRVYQFGKVEKGKGYYGKVTPDVTYSVIYTKGKMEYLDKMYQYAENRMTNPRELLCAGNLQYVTSKGVARLIDSYPGVVSGKDLIAPFTVGSKEDPTLIELIDPPGLSFLITETMESLNIVFGQWLKRDEDGKSGDYHQFVDITDLIYEKETNGKGVTKLKLHPEFKQGTLVLKYNAFHPKAVCPVPLMLSVGYDIPERNGFNSITDPNVKVWLDLDFSNDACLIYRTIVETEDFNYLFSSGGANVRVLNKKELGNK